MHRMKKSFRASLSALMLSALLLSGCAQQEKTKTYTFHDVYVGAEGLVKENKNTSSCEDIYLNEDGSLSLVLTDKQRKKWQSPQRTESLLAAMKMMGVDIDYSEDYTKMTISAPAGVAEAASPMILNFAWVAEKYQILNGAESWSLEVTVINTDDGKIVQQVTLPQDELDWSFIESE